MARLSQPWRIQHCLAGGRRALTGCTQQGSAGREQRPSQGFFHSKPKEPPSESKPSQQSDARWALEKRKKLRSQQIPKTSSEPGTWPYRSHHPAHPRYHCQPSFWVTKQAQRNLVLLSKKQGLQRPRPLPARWTSLPNLAKFFQKLLLEGRFGLGTPLDLLPKSCLPGQMVDWISVLDEERY
ncbi:hypothetical protein H920_18195 [Fukomys damarensis]|uniref:Uncharacterized protein n=1 Tax=Fukomys damarensis TaxID=885580 RepID=A0A091CNC1_FUKDA|nr:hypothetical protein H920_18195 [Fukomys damarensis]